MKILFCANKGFFKDFNLPTIGKYCIEEQGFEVFKANLASSLKMLNYKITDIISCTNCYDFDMNVDCYFTALVEKVGVKVEAK